MTVIVKVSWTISDERQSFETDHITDQ